MADEFVERNIPPRKNCEKADGSWGRAMTDLEYIWFGNKDKDTYPEDACLPFQHHNAQIDDFTINNHLTGKTAAFSGTVTASSVTCGGVKCFNIPHPTKNNKRLVHACIEGPEAAVYIRGRLTDNNVIELPDYWKGLVDPETISVHLTQIGSSQDLMVDKIVWGRTIYIKSGTASMIDCYYTVSAVRIDIPALEIEQDA